MSEELILETKPKFTGYVRFFALSLYADIFGGMIGVTIWVVCIFLITMTDLQMWVSLVIIYILCTLLTLGILMFLDKKNFEVTSYKVFPARIEFEEGFLNPKYTTIKIEDIKEIHFSQNFVQRNAKLGTIKFITVANTDTTGTGLTFTDIEYPDVIYNKIKQIPENI